MRIDCLCALVKCMLVIRQKKLGCNQLGNCLVCVSFAVENGMGGRAKAKKFGFFENKHMHTAS